MIKYADCYKQRCMEYDFQRPVEEVLYREAYEEDEIGLGIAALIVAVTLFVLF